MPNPQHKTEHHQLDRERSGCWFRGAGPSIMDLLLLEKSIKNALLNQDNQAAIRLHENGVMSRKKKSRHIDIRFFFIKDRIEKGDVEVAFCGTEEMVADYLTKPLQGAVFRRFRDAIMGIKRRRCEGMC